MGKRWITIDCILPVVEMMNDRSRGIDLWEQAYTGLAWLIMGTTHWDDSIDIQQIPHFTFYQGLSALLLFI